MELIEFDYKEPERKRQYKPGDLVWYKDVVCKVRGAFKGSLQLLAIGTTDYFVVRAHEVKPYKP